MGDYGQSLVGDYGRSPVIAHGRLRALTVAIARGRLRALTVAQGRNRSWAIASAHNRSRSQSLVGDCERSRSPIDTRSFSPRAFTGAYQRKNKIRRGVGKVGHCQYRASGDLQATTIDRDRS